MNAPEVRIDNPRRALGLLLGAQFLTAFADNAILFAAFAMVIASGVGEWYQPALQASFLLAFVLLAPWVGPFADRRPKRTVLAVGNAVKAAGAGLLLAGVEPLAAYAVVGIGAAIYGPAKYGILPELVERERLVKANGWVEGSTIVAIVLGAVIGAHLADRSIGGALALIVVAYLASLAGALLLPATADRNDHRAPALRQFGRTLKDFLATPRARFSMLGAAIFWAASVVLRVMLVAWAPAVLLTANTADVANLTVYIAAGIALGSLVVPRLIPIERLRRARMAGYLMGALILLLGATNDTAVANGLLFAIGLAGGLFVVPINAALQEIGHRSVGAGNAVAAQNFFENLAMLTATGLYTLALAEGLDPVLGLTLLGTLVVVATALVSWRLPPEEQATASTGTEATEG
ncbi:lysophospholipid transporter LplT [Endothiovibrio diazotrophicus]